MGRDGVKGHPQPEKEYHEFVVSLLQLGSGFLLSQRCDIQFKNR